MNKSSFGQYKYNAPEEFLINEGGGFIKIIFFFFYCIMLYILFTFLVNITELTYIIVFALGVLGLGILKGIGSSNKKILVGNRYVIIGEKIIYYNNLAGVELSDGSSSYEMITKNNKRYKIEMNKFPTNARKSWKIEKNKKDKFEKITAKISENISKCAPSINIKKVF